jgi:autotransporter-associated beta strand protein
MSGSTYRKALAVGRKALSKNRFAMAAATAVAAMWAPGAFAQLGTTTQIGIDLTTGRGENNSLAAGDEAGAPGFRQTNWNNITGNVNNTGLTQTFTTVNPTSGVTSSVTLTMWWGSPNSWSLSTNSPATADGRMMNGYLDSNNGGTGATDLTAAAAQPYVAISGLTGEFLNGYKVVLYADGDATANRTAQYWLTSFRSGTPNNVSTESELTPRVFIRDNANFNGAPTGYVQVPMSSNTGAGASAGNYVVFDGLNSPNFVVRAEEFLIDTPRAPINGIQIIASPILPTDDTEWALSGGGSWPNAGSWLGGVPDGTSYSANFLSKATGPAAVTLNNNVQVKKIRFDNTNPYTVSGSGSITVNPNSGLGSVTVASGNHSILVPMTVNISTTFDIAASSGLTLASISAGPNLVSKEGAGTLNLNGSVKWGAFVVNNGLVKLGASNVLSAGAVNGAASGTIDINGFSQNLPRLEGAVNITNSRTNLTNLFLNPETGALNLHTGNITGAINVDISGGGTQGIGGPTASNYTGLTTISGFTTVRTTSNTAFGSTAQGTVLDNGWLNLWNADLGNEAFTISNGSSLIQFFDRGTIRGPITYGGGYIDLIVDANSGAAGSSISLLGDISGNIRIGKLGGNGLVLGGHNTFTQGLNVNQGWLGIAGNSDATAGPVGPVSSILQLFNVGLRSIGGNHSISNPINIISSTGLTVDPDPAGGTNVGVLTLTGPIDLKDPSLGNGVRNIITNADIVFAGKVSNGGIVKSGNGILTLSNPGNDFNMGLTLNAGKVSISQNSNLGATQPIFFQGGMIQVTGTTLTNLDAREANINYSSFSGGFDIADAANTFTVRAPIAGPGFFRKDGAGTLLLTGTNTYTGGTTVNGGVLRPVNSVSLPDARAMTVNGGLLDLNGFSKTFTSLNGTGGAIGNGTNGNITVTVGTGNADASWAGSLQNGPGTGVTSLTKSGTGTQVLRGASTYTGATAVNAGTLQVDGSLANTAVTVANNATLSGSGAIAGAVTIQSGGTIAPLATQLNVGALTLNAGSKLTFLLGASTTSSLINVTNPNGLTLSGGAITLNPAPGVPGSSYDLIKYTGTHVGTIANLTLANPNVGDTTYTLVDDPGRAIGIVIGTSLLTWTGAANGSWDTTSTNWQGGANVFANGRNVRFDDSGTATNVDVASTVTPGRVDLFNVTKDYTFTGAGSIGGAGTTVIKQGAGKAIFNQPLTNTGATVINSGVVQLNGAATLNATSGITLNNTGSNPRDNAYPLTLARGGTLYLNGNSVADRLGAVPVTMNGGTIVALKGAPNGAGTTTVQNVTANSAMSRLIAAPSGGTHTLVVGNLTRAAGSTATMDFRSAFGTLGGTGDNGAIKITNLNGAAFSTANLSNGLIGAWATTGDNYASYDAANGVIGNVTNVDGAATGALVDGPTNNVRNTSGQNLTATGNVTVNSLISGADVIIPSGSTLTINSGAAMMSGPNKWWQGGGNIRAGAGVSQMVFTVNDTGNDHRLQLALQDNGTPLTFIKNGDGFLNLDRANTYTGPTIVNAGTLSVRNGSALGSNNLAVTVRPGATFDLGGQNLGTREVIISGAGASTGSGTAITTVGALTNTFADQTNAVINLTMTADATIGGGRRWDLRTQGTNLAVLNGGTFTLTKVGTNNISVVAPGTINVGNIVVNEGQLSFENGNNIMGSTVHTVTINSGGTLAFWNNIAGGITQNKPVVLNGGIVSSDNGPTALTGPVYLASNGQLRANNVFNVTNVVSGPGGFTKSGNNTLTLSNTNTYSGETVVNAGTLMVTGSIANSAVTVNNTGSFPVQGTKKIAGLTVNTGGLVQLPAPAAPGARNVLTVGSGTSATSPFSIPGTGTNAGRLDIDRNGMIVDVAAGGEAAALTAVRLAAGNAFNGGQWNQPGLTSGLITASNRLAIGFGLPADVPAVITGGTQFYGSPVDASSVVTRVTVGGDATMDSLVNFDDLLALAKSYNSTTAYWAKGDFDYNAIVNFDDLLILAKNYNAVMPSEAIPGATAEFKADMAAAFAQAAVPEPTGLALLGLAGAAMMGGRRRRSRAN